MLDRSLAPARTTAHSGLLPALLVVTLLTAMDQTIVATALPAIVGDVGGRASVGWVFAGYTLAMTVAMPLFGRLGDLRGRRTIYLSSIAAFVLASGACGVASDMHMLIALRILQGVAGGGVLVMSQAVVADAVPARERARFMAPVGLVFAVSSVISPLLGGTLTDTVGWRWIFWVNLPLGTLAWVLSYRAVPRARSAGRGGGLDVPGFVLYAVAITGLVVLATGQVADAGWLSARFLGWVGVTAVCGAGFAVRMLTHADPLIPIGVLRNRTVAVASCLGFVNGAAVFGLVGYLPTVVQSVLGLRPTMSGAILLALVLGMMVSTVTTGRWTSRTGHYRRLPLIGCLLGAGAMSWLATLDQSWGIGRAAAAIALLGLGAGFFMQVITIAAQDAAPPEHVGSSTSTVSLVRELGVTIGAASLGAAFAAHGTANDLGAGVETAVPAVFTALMLVLLGGAAVSLALPDRRLSAHVG
ncbi:MDR family MFS transporter [Nocardioides panacihumi]|uniref:MDR family MFS transporter n=1 Tax=Nocardioides panacihumi TaxID=400774 RepID=A0ABN2R7F7_9ACTN